MELYHIDRKSEKDAKTFTKNGKSWTAWPVGVKINGEWWNGLLNDHDKANFDKIIEGSRANLVLFEKNGYKNFRFPSEQDELNEKVEYCTQFIRWFFNTFPDDHKENFLKHLEGIK